MGNIIRTTYLGRHRTARDTDGSRKRPVDISPIDVVVLVVVVAMWRKGSLPHCVHKLPLVTLPNEHYGQ